MASYIILLTVIKSNSPISTAKGKTIVRQIPIGEETALFDLEQSTKVAALMSKDHRTCVLVSRLQGTYHAMGCEDQVNGGFTPESES